MKKAEQSETTKLPSNLFKVLQAIAEGYYTRSEEDRWIIVENPLFEEDNGQDPNLVLDIWDYVLSTY